MVVTAVDKLGKAVLTMVLTMVLTTVLDKLGKAVLSTNDSRQVYYCMVTHL